jgi:nucleotide-binding universal stress UspA family protein
VTVFARIVVGVDGREGGRDALALAAALQVACGGELTAVYAYPYDRSVPLDRANAIEATLEQDLLAKLEAELARAGVCARPLVIADASPARALHAIAERDGADLIVVGAPHRAGADRVLGGDVAANTLHAAPCAVAVAPRGHADAPRALFTVGVGFDDSHEARAALALAHDVADAAGATVYVFTVVMPPVTMWPGAALDPEWAVYDDAARQRGERELQSALAETGGACCTEVLVGNPAHELARRSRKLDLLVVGSRSYGPARRLLLGSTSTRLVRESACPLLVLPRSVRDHSTDESIAAAAAP